jgi:hypothetical protein
MYEDDRGWTESGYDIGVDGVEPGDEEIPGRKGKGRAGLALGKRMPVEREEVIRLMLQGLRDIGYK